MKLCPYCYQRHEYGEECFVRPCLLCGTDISNVIDAHYCRECTESIVRNLAELELPPDHEVQWAEIYALFNSASIDRVQVIDEMFRYICGRTFSQFLSEAVNKSVKGEGWSAKEDANG